MLHTRITRAQDKGQPFQRIEWIKQYPSGDWAPVKKKFGKRLAELFTGKDKASRLSKPVNLVTGPDGVVWVLDQGNQTVIKVKNGVGEMPHFKSRDDRFLPSLVGICTFKDGNILITDSFLGKCYIVSTDNDEIREFNQELLLEQPTGIGYNAENKQIWVSETKKHSISILDEEGNFIKTIGSRGAKVGEFNYPTSIWIDKSGTVFIVDAMNFRVQIFSKGGEYISSFGEAGDATGYFARPKGIATDSYGNIYVSDALFHTVQIFDIHGNFLYNFGSQGTGRGEFWMPAGIFIDNDDYIYVSDMYNSRIQVFQLIKANEDE